MFIEAAELANLIQSAVDGGIWFGAVFGVAFAIPATLFGLAMVDEWRSELPR